MIPRCYNYPVYCYPFIPVQRPPHTIFTSDYPMATGDDLDQFIQKLTSNPPVKYKVNRKFKDKNTSFVIFTTKINGTDKKFILKQQDPTDTPMTQYTVVLEAVAAKIAEEMGLPINRVRILPPNVAFKNKPFPNYPATIHTFIEGNPVKGLGIQQKTGEDVLIKNRGLTLSVIKNMSKHEDLSKIVAFDTFLGNNDRHDWNVFYSPPTNHYIGFDQGSIFIKIVTDAIRNIKALQKTKTLSSQEREALRKYRSILYQLQQNYSIEKINQYLDQETQLSGLRELGPTNYNENDVCCLKQSQKENIDKIPILIEELDKLLR